MSFSLTYAADKQTNKQIDKQIDSKILPTPTDRINDGKNNRVNGEHHIRSASRQLLCSGVYIHLHTYI